MKKCAFIKRIFIAIFTFFIFVGAHAAQVANVEYIHNTTDFSFKISAAGNFVIDWGNGKIQNIAKENTTNTPYSHNYQIADEYKIKITGRASAYSKTANTAAVSFEYNNNIAKIDGCSSLKQIPDYLFAGLKGTLAAGLFYRTFQNCSSLSTIPTYLFGELSGYLQSKTFSNMFKGCVNLSGLSAKILSADKTFMQFLYTRWTGGNSLTVADMYNGCTGLTDYEDIPTVWK